MRDLHLINNKLLKRISCKVGEWLSVTLEGFRPSSYLTSVTARLQETVGNGKAIAAVSGGVDITVAALVAKSALGVRVLRVFMNMGFLLAGIPEYGQARLGGSSLALKVKLLKA